MSKKVLLEGVFGIVVVVVILTAVAIFVPRFKPLPSVSPVTETPSAKLQYKNTEYGFTVDLPESWRGYTVTIDTWTGNAINDQLGDVPFTQGPVVSIHNPKWTKELMYQDIPVMVFTLQQWNDLQADKFHIGAAPIGPSELDRNMNYVFALPARYNYAFLPGYEEVDQILQGRPLHAF